MATGNTFGATALSSYGGFWLSYAIILTPGFHVLDKYSATESANVLGFFLSGWFIFTTLLVLCTLRSTVALFLLFFTLDLAFLFLACEQFATNLGNKTAAVALQKTGGLFGFLAAFLAWYNALAGMQDSSYVTITSSYYHAVNANLSPATRSSRFPSSTSPGPTTPRSSRSRRAASTRLKWLNAFAPRGCVLTRSCCQA